jgi:hypothetical protein
LWAASNCRKTETVRRGGRRVRILGESAIAWNQHGRQGIQGVAHVKWTDYVTAAGALGFIFVVAVGVIQIGRARKAEAAQWAMETKKEWAQDLGGVRWKVAEHGKTPDALRDKLKELWEANHPDYYELLRELQYWDRVGFLVRRGSLSRSALHALTGPDAAFRWSLWQPAVEEFLRKEPPGGLGFSNAYNQFQFLAEKRSAKHLHEYEDVQPAPHDAEYRGPR